MSKRGGNKRRIGVCQGPLEYSCSLCGFTSLSPTGVRLHLKATHKENERKSRIEGEKISKDKCTVCKKTFRGIEEVIRHVKKVHRET